MELKIDVLGSSFTIKSSEDPQYLSQVLNHLKQRIKEVENRIGPKDPLKIAILTSMTLCGELIRQQNNPNNQKPLDFDIEQITQNLIDKIDRVIDTK